MPTSAIDSLIFRNILGSVEMREVSKLTNPESYLGLSAAMVNRVLQQAG